MTGVDMLGCRNSAGVRSGERRAGVKTAVGVDPIDGIVEAFGRHEVVMLPGGYGSRQGTTCSSRSCAIRAFRARSPTS